MNILWFSNISIVNWKNNKSGTWIYSMYKQLCFHPEVCVLGNITLGNNKDLKVKKQGEFVEYYVPTKWFGRDGQPKNDLVMFIAELISKIKPDLIHIWGLEINW